MRGKLHIVYATDERYLLPTRVAAASAVYYASRPKYLVIDILDCDISDASWTKFEADLKKARGDEFALNRHKVDMSAYAQYKSWHTSRGIYARLSIPDILPEDVDWCVYADGDTLFVSDPFELESIFHPQYALMGHLDQPGADLREWYVKNGFNWDAKTYVCAGFIILNLVWARKNQLSAKCFDLIRQHPDIPMNDQDALNILCADEKAFLPDGWGVFANEAYWRTKPNCIHYVGERPWELPSLKGVWLPNTTRLWFAVARHACGLRVWNFGGILFAGRFVALGLLARFMSVGYRILDLVGTGKRYQAAQARFRGDWQAAVRRLTRF